MKKKPIPENPTDNKVTEITPYRFNLTVPEGKEGLEKIEKAAGKTTIVEMVRSAIIFYEIAIKHRNAGGKIVFRDKNGKEETMVLL